MLEDYVVVDLEMTGLKAKSDRILEIGAVKVEGGMEMAVFHCMVNPHMEIPAEITALTGITNEMASGGRDSAKAVRDFADFSHPLPLVGHNIRFDYGFLKQAALNHGIPLERECLDTLKLSRKFLAEAEKKTLDYLCAYLGICREKSHRALEDAKATNELFRYLQEKFGEAHPSAFLPAPLQCKLKKQGPASPRQIKRLKELAACHGITLTAEAESLTKNEASRLTDKILAAYGKAPAAPNSGEKPN